MPSGFLLFSDTTLHKWSLFSRSHLQMLNIIAQAQIYTHIEYKLHSCFVGKNICSNSDSLQLTKGGQSLNCAKDVCLLLALLEDVFW